MCHGPFDFNADPTSQYWEIEFPDRHKSKWSDYFENMPQYVWDELDPSDTDTLDVSRVFELLEELSRN